MKYLPLLAAASALLLCPALLTAADSSRESEQVRILQSNASPREKDAACALLKRIGTAQSVPALSALLADEQLSHSARYALESMDAPEAGKALLEALPHTSGPTRAGIIASLGLRQEKDAAAPLSGCLADPDVTVGTAAARALGRIGGPAALKTLEAAAMTAAGPMRDAVNEALLEIADRLRLADRPGDALRIFKTLYLTGGQEHTRAAAYRGVLLTSGRRSLTLVKEALQGQPGPAQSAALQLVHELTLTGLTDAVCQVLRRTPPPMQVALVGALAQRGESSACPAITPLLTTPNPEVRIAALASLALLGDGKVVKPIAEVAAHSTGNVQTAARQALVGLQPRDVDPVMLALLVSGTPGVQAELARALGERGTTAAAPRLVEMARETQGTAQASACQALASLARESDLPALVDLVKAADSEEKRALTAETLNAVMQRILKSQGRVDTSPLLRGVESASPEAKLALLPVCGGLAEPAVREVLRRGLQDSDLRLRAAFIRASCDTVDPEMLPDLLSLTQEGTEGNTRTLAVRACVRLVKEDESSKLSNARKLEILRTLLDRGLDPKATRAVLGGMAEVPEKQALALVEPFLQNAALQAEAARAAIKIATTIPDNDAASAALRKVIATVNDAASRETASAALKAIEARLDYLTSWKIAGPFREDGKNYAALFDTVFPPESSGGKAGEWRPLPPCPDPNRPYSNDLLAALGGEQAVAYAKTWVHSEQESPAVIEIGSDDGIKVWLNEALVHANNTARPLVPGSDKANATLKRGWNLLLVKLTQNNLGWEFSMRFVKPDGSRLADLRSDPNHVPGQ